MKLWFDENDPATWSTATAVEWAVELASQAGGGASVRRRRARTGVKFAVEKLGHEMSGYRSEVIVCGAAPCWIGHSQARLAGRVRLSAAKARVRR